MRRLALLGAQQLDQVGEVGFVQRKRELAYVVGIALIERRLDGVQEVGAKRPLLVAQFDLACGVLHGPVRSPSSNCVQAGGPRPGGGIGAEKASLDCRSRPARQARPVRH